MNRNQDLESLLARGFRFALALAHDEARAEDLLQDAWVSILRRGGPRHVGYLFQTIRNRFLDQERRERLVTLEPLDTRLREQARKGGGDQHTDRRRWPVARSTAATETRDQR